MQLPGETSLHGRPMAPAPWLTTRFPAAAIVGTAIVALALGIPTDLVPNRWFTRMPPAGLSNYFFWIATSLLTGTLLAILLLPRLGAGRPESAGVGSGILGLLAAGCPVCNKLVVALLGVSGALSYFEPIQPFLGAAGLLIVAVTVCIRVRGARQACRLPAGGVRAASARRA